MKFNALLPLCLLFVPFLAPAASPTLPDVTHENHWEAFAQAMRPTTSIEARQYEVRSKRARLEPTARTECQSLDRSIASLEDAEREAKYLKLREIQKDLSSQRQRFHELGC